MEMFSERATTPFFPLMLLRSISLIEKEKEKKKQVSLSLIFPGASGTESLLAGKNKLACYFYL